MSVLLALLGVSLCMAGIAFAFFVAATKSGQFDDLVLPAQRAVFDEVDKPVQDKKGGLP